MQSSRRGFGSRSCALLLVSGATVAAPNGRTVRVSVHSNGHHAAGGDSNFAVISGDGRFVAFDSTATNLVPGDTHFARDAFLHDRRSGATTRLSNTGFDASAGFQCAADPAISRDGRIVAFFSNVDPLVPNDTNGVRDIFAYDTRTEELSRVGVNTGGFRMANVSAAEVGQQACERASFQH